MENKYELYKKLLNMDGIPGHERQVKKFVKEQEKNTQAAGRMGSSRGNSRSNY